MAMTPATEQEQQEPWYLRSSVPVLFPTHDGFDLSMPQAAFEGLIQGIVRLKDTAQRGDTEVPKEQTTTDENVHDTPVSTPGREIQSSLAQLDLGTTAAAPAKDAVVVEQDKPDESQHPFIRGLLSQDRPQSASVGDLENRMLTENADVAYRSTNSPLVDLFAELEDVVSGPRLRELLTAAWGEDALSTLKIIFNARSIHLGKASRSTFYRCAGWLAQHHPLTLIANLRWLSRPVIAKKAEKKEETDSDMVLVEDVKPEKEADDVARFDVEHGVSHGYWKDLLNILVLAARGHLNVLADPRDVLNVERQHDGTVSQEEAKARRHNKRDKRSSEAIALFNSDPVYRGLHLTVARLFAEQLQTDLALLRGQDAKAKNSISLCAKWAPSHDRFHDKHTVVVSGIAELLHPAAEVAADRDGAAATDRERHLRHARERYRRDVSALRAHLDVVERKLAAKSYDQVRYDRVPSVAMSNYSKTFAAKDTARFEAYLDRVAEGKAAISGATLLPSTLIKRVRDDPLGVGYGYGVGGGGGGGPIGARLRALATKAADGQWKALVQRVKDAGTLGSSLAICDVSGSMLGPVFPDGTCPMDSAIGLSLLLAEVTAPPFGGHLITFSANPAAVSVDPAAPLRDKVHRIAGLHWDMNTDFVAVFERLILPMARREKLAQADMVKRVFVFSDMQFDAAQGSGHGGHGHGDKKKNNNRFGSSFERIKRRYAEAGYEMPELVFWNLAGGRAGYGRGTGGDPTAPKPVTAEEEGTTLVSGYSQAMLKLFLDDGVFDDPDAEDGEGDLEMKDEGDAVVVGAEAPAKKRKTDPLAAVKKAIGHKAYDPLVVVD